MPEKLKKRQVYRAAYQQELEDPVTQEEPVADPDNTSPDPATPEENSWRKRYGDLRTHSTSLTERIKELESQLLAAQRKEVKIPSTQEELTGFARQYPDIYRHIRSIAMAELLQERENIAQETQAVKNNLEKMERELGYKKIMAAHPDFEAINGSEEFHTWASIQPQQIQDWLFESTDPDLCIKALDLYKAETGFKKQAAKRSSGADTAVRTRTPVEVSNEGGKKVWKASEIGKLTPKQFEKLEADIELAREEGRLDPYS